MKNCPACKEKYSLNLNKPYILNCGDTICNICLELLKDKNCPICNINIETKTINKDILELNKNLEPSYNNLISNISKLEEKSNKYSV